jgi:hypothetical protein
MSSQQSQMLFSIIRQAEEETTNMKFNLLLFQDIITFYELMKHEKSGSFLGTDKKVS